MKKILKNRKIIYILIIVSIIGIILLNNNFKIIEKITNGRLQNADEETEEQPLISYQVYDNSDESKIKTLVNVNDNSGIEYIEYPDGTKLDTKDKTQISVDYNMEKDKNYTFKIKTMSNETLQEKTICANDEFIYNNSINIEKIKEENGYKIINIANQVKLSGFKTYYKVGENGNWVEGNGKISLLDYDLTTNKLINEDNTITISAKIENKDINQSVNISKKYDVDTNSTISSFEADSLLNAFEKYEFANGVFKIKVKDETYSLKVYSFNEDLNIKADTTLGTEEDVATATEYAKNMIVLKVDGDLTIDEGVKLTAYASKNGYGGPKGMMIYCTGTISNKGTISMTAKGAKAVGQNVYLWKNEDNSYEYVPAIGANGGAMVGGKAIDSDGNDGQNGTNRQTGGGGSGSCYQGRYTTAYSGAGSKGTSYSGGTGGGVWAVYSSGKSNDGDPNRWTRGKLSRKFYKRFKNRSWKSRKQ